MYTLAHPWLLALILLPLILRLALPAYREPKQAIRVPWFGRLAALLGATPGEGAVIARTSLLRLGFMWLLWSLLVLAIARPEEDVQTIAMGDSMLAAGDILTLFSLARVGDETSLEVLYGLLEDEDWRGGGRLN